MPQKRGSVIALILAPGDVWGVVPVHVAIGVMVSVEIVVMLDVLVDVKDPVVLPARAIISISP